MSPFSTRTWSEAKTERCGLCFVDKKLFERQFMISIDFLFTHQYNHIVK